MMDKAEKKQCLETQSRYSEQDKSEQTNAEANASTASTDTSAEENHSTGKSCKMQENSMLNSEQSLQSGDTVSNRLESTDNGFSDSTDKEEDSSNKDENTLSEDSPSSVQFFKTQENIWSSASDSHLEEHQPEILEVKGSSSCDNTGVTAEGTSLGRWTTKKRKIYPIHEDDGFLSLEGEVHHSYPESKKKLNLRISPDSQLPVFMKLPAMPYQFEIDESKFLIQKFDFCSEGDSLGKPNKCNCSAIAEDQDKPSNVQDCLSQRKTPRKKWKLPAESIRKLLSPIKETPIMNDGSSIEGSYKDDQDLHFGNQKLSLDLKTEELVIEESIPASDENKEFNFECLQDETTEPSEENIYIQNMASGDKSIEDETRMLVSSLNSNNNAGQTPMKIDSKPQLEEIADVVNTLAERVENLNIDETEATNMHGDAPEKMPENLEKSCSNGNQLLENEQLDDKRYTEPISEDYNRLYHDFMKELGWFFDFDIIGDVPNANLENNSSQDNPVVEQNCPDKDQKPRVDAGTGRIIPPNCANFIRELAGFFREKGVEFPLTNAALNAARETKLTRKAVSAEHICNKKENDTSYTTSESSNYSEDASVEKDQQEVLNSMNQRNSETESYAINDTTDDRNSFYDNLRLLMANENDCRQECDLQTVVHNPRADGKGDIPLSIPEIINEFLATFSAGSGGGGAETDFPESSPSSQAQNSGVQEHHVLMKPSDFERVYHGFVRPIIMEEVEAFPELTGGRMMTGYGLREAHTVIGMNIEQRMKSEYFRRLVLSKVKDELKKYIATQESLRNQSNEANDEPSDQRQIPFDWRIRQMPSEEELLECIEIASSEVFDMWRNSMERKAFYESDDDILIEGLLEDDTDSEGSGVDSDCTPEYLKCSKHPNYKNNSDEDKDINESSWSLEVGTSAEMSETNLSETQASTLKEDSKEPEPTENKKAKSEQDSTFKEQEEY